MRFHIITLAAIAMAIPVYGAPVATIRPDAVEVTGIATGNSVALLGVLHEPTDYDFRVHTLQAALTDDDRDGVVRYEFPKGVRGQSVWIAAEIGTGAVAVASPNSVVHVRTVPPAALRSPGALAIVGDLIEVLYVRPGSGVWRTTIVDSGRNDQDHRPDGMATISIADLKPLAGDVSSPLHYRGGDLLFAIDVMSLNVYRFDGGK